MNEQRYLKITRAQLRQVIKLSNDMNDDQIIDVKIIKFTSGDIILTDKIEIREKITISKNKLDFKIKKILLNT